MAVDGHELQQRYIDSLLDRITETEYPSAELLDRAENLSFTPEQADRLVSYLIDRVDSCQYPSHHLMDRVERILFGTIGR